MVKQQVLAALDAARGRYISGQELAAQLGVSRTAVWKAVAALRSDGIPIEAVTNRGYALAADADVLNAAAVAALPAPFGAAVGAPLPCGGSSEAHLKGGPEHDFSQSKQKRTARHLQAGRIPLCPVRQPAGATNPPHRIPFPWRKQ